MAIVRTHLPTTVQFWLSHLRCPFQGHGRPSSEGVRPSARRGLGLRGGLGKLTFRASHWKMMVEWNFILWIYTHWKHHPDAGIWLFRYKLGPHGDQAKQGFHWGMHRVTLGCGAKSEKGWKRAKTLKVRKSAEGSLFRLDFSRNFVLGHYCADGRWGHKTFRLRSDMFLLKTFILSGQSLSPAREIIRRYPLGN